MQVAGGCYLERCDEPHWHQLYGSGGRAAAALMARGCNIRLSTYLPAANRAMLETLAATYGFAVVAEEAPSVISFHYIHPMAVPTIRPAIGTIDKLSPIQVDGMTILRFGFIEGDAVVNGSRVTYDPQSAFDPRPFTENGSTAEHLAVVCNAAEARMLSSSDDLDVAANKLIDEGAEVVVIKMGTAGALVRTQDDVTRIHSYKTSRVWPIGSGDVFAAVFAYEWGEAQQSPADAAMLASRSTAFYCATQTLPVPVPAELPDLQPLNSVPDITPPPLVYLAGPFFTTAQRWLISELRRHLSNQNLSVFSPFHDVGHGVADDVVPKDIEAIRSSSAMLAVLNGLDSGTLFEVGYARALGIPVVGFVQAESSESMKMLEGTGCTLCDDFASAVYHTVWALCDE